MKLLIILSILLLLTISSYSQVTEGKSGIVQFSISKPGIKKAANENRAPADQTAPRITIESPVLGPDSLIKTPGKTLLVKGAVSDQGGIYEVLVNGVEAKVSADGIFLAEIPVAFGKSNVTVKAADIAQNVTTVRFISDRSTAVIAAQPVVPVNTGSINIISPGSAGVPYATDKLILKACIKSELPIRKLVIYRGETFINGYIANQMVRKGDCNFEINEPVTLKMGNNNIIVEAYTESDTLRKSIIVEYSFYAARNFALIIGNEKYDDRSIMELSEPVKDATELYKTLTTKYNFEPANVVLLKNPEKADIIGRLHELRSKVTGSDNLLIFYAGHGFWDEGMQVGYWLPKDARKDNPVNWIPNTDLTNYLGAIKSKHTLLIADACFSGGIFKSRAAFSNTYAVEMLYQMSSRNAITSGNQNEEVPDKSVFAQYLLKNLNDNDQEYLPAEELFSKMKMAVMNNTKNLPRFGTIQNVGDEGGDFIFIKRRAVTSK